VRTPRGQTRKKIILSRASPFTLLMSLPKSAGRHPGYRCAANGPADLRRDRAALSTSVGERLFRDPASRRSSIRTKEVNTRVSSLRVRFRITGYRSAWMAAAGLWTTWGANHDRVPDGIQLLSLFDLLLQAVADPPSVLWDCGQTREICKVCQAHGGILANPATGDGGLAEFSRTPLRWRRIATTRITRLQ
jgi:hypothetical protein